MPKPVGSGYFAAAAGCLFLVTLIASFVLNLANLDPYVLFRIWLLFAGVVLCIWGGVRVQKGEKGDLRIGQPTINFVVAIFAVTFAILALVRES